MSAQDETKKSAGFERLGQCLYRKGTTIYARVRLNGKATWRSTETNDPAQARQWLKKWRSERWMLDTGIEPKGVVLHRKRVTVQALIDVYVAAGFPPRKERTKSPATITNEKACLKPVAAFFGGTAAASLSHDDCDKYKDWRLSGGYFKSEKVRQAKARMKTGNRSVDLELTILSNVLHLAVKRQMLERNPLLGRSRYTEASEIRHCREVAPSPEGLQQIEHWFRVREEDGTADLVCFLAFSGLRIGEALPLDWETVNWATRVIHVKREKKGILPYVPILPAMDALLRGMQQRAKSPLLFPSPFSPEEPRDDSAVRHRLSAACQSLQIGHVTPHGLRSYFVTQARQSGLSDAEIAMLIGDKSGPAIIAQTYGDVRPDHLFKQAQRIQIKVMTDRSDSPNQVEAAPNGNAPTVWTTAGATITFAHSTS